MRPPPRHPQKDTTPIGATGQSTGNDPLEHRRIRFEGRVQGVGFRATCRAVVDRLGGLTGWVRNEPDGAVLLHLQGSSTAIDTALDHIRRHFPHHIHAEHADRAPTDPDLTAFSVRR